MRRYDCLRLFIGSKIYAELHDTLPLIVRNAQRQ
jgi:hypothetical protein